MSSSESKSKSPRAQLTLPDLLSLHRHPHPPPHPKLTLPDLLSMLPNKSSFENPLPPRIIKISPRSITQAAPDADWIKKLMADQQLSQANLSILRKQALEEASRYKLPSRLPPSSRAAQAVSIFEPFRNHMHMESGTTILVLDDKTRIDMGNVDIDTAVRRLRRVDSDHNVVTYSIAGFPEIKMGILDGRIILLPQPPQPESLPQPPQTESNRQVNLILRRLQGKNKIKPTDGGRTRARKMGRKGRKGTNKRRRYIVAKTRLRRGNKMPRTLRN